MKKLNPRKTNVSSRTLHEARHIAFRLAEDYVPLLDKSSRCKSNASEALSIISDFAIFVCANERPRKLNTRAWMVCVTNAMEALSSKKIPQLKDLVDGLFTRTLE